MHHPSFPRAVPKRAAAATAAATVLLLGLTACGPKGADAQSGHLDATPHKGGTLTVLNTVPQNHFDPARLYTTGGGNIPGLVFRSLTTRTRANGEAGTKVAPDLATTTGTPSHGATVWTYTLKRGVTYQDGSPVTAADVKYGIERSFAPELSGGPPYLRDWLVGAADYQGPYKGATLKSIATPDARTIVFHLRKPEGQFPYLATQTQFSPVPKKKDDGTKYASHPVATGPYEVVENQNDGEHLILRRNPHWSAATDSQRAAYPDRVDVRSGLDPAVINQRLSASQGPDAAAVTTDTNLGPAQLAKVKGDKELSARVGTGHFGDTDYIAFNPKVKPFDNPKVRQAIAYAVDRGSVVDALGGSALSEPATTFLPNQKAYGYTPYDPFPAGKSGNPAKARAVLKEAGYPKGITVTLTHDNSNGNDTGPAVATALQDALRKAGITVKLHGLENNDYDQTVKGADSEPGFFLSGWGADWPTGGPFLAPVFDGRQIVRHGANFNTGFLNDASVNKEIDEANALTDPAAAARRWGALDKKIGAKALTVPLAHPVYERLVGKDVRHVVISDWTGVLDVAQIAVK